MELNIPKGKIVIVDGDTGQILMVKKQKTKIPNPPGMELDRAMCAAEDHFGFIINYIMQQQT